MKHFDSIKKTVCLVIIVVSVIAMIIACLILCGAVIFEKKNWATIAGKIAFIGMIIFLIVPASVKLSDMVYQTQAEKVNNTVEEYNELDIEGESDEGILGEIKAIKNSTVEKVTTCRC